MRSRILVREAERDEASVLLVDGVLDSTTYLRLRDHIVKAALEEPRAVVVNVSALRVPVASAYAVFTSARWQVSRWPDIPVLLVCGHPRGRDAISRQGVTRYVQVHDCLDSAMAALVDLGDRVRRRRSAELPCEPGCATYARDLVTDWLWEWGQSDKIVAARLIATVLVDNVFDHTDSVPHLRVESYGATVTVAVSDDSDRLPALRKITHDTLRLPGLQMVAAVTDTWGFAPSADGKTVWASIMSPN